MRPLLDLVIQRQSGTLGADHLGTGDQGVILAELPLLHPAGQKILGRLQSRIRWKFICRRSVDI